MQRVIVESPYSGASPEAIQSNIQYLKNCLTDCLIRGESPYASHLFFTQILDDNMPFERDLGIQAGQAWYEGAQKIAVYMDRGLSYGMKMGIAHATKYDIPISFRKLYEPAYGITLTPDVAAYGAGILDHIDAWVNYGVSFPK